METSTFQGKAGRRTLLAFLGSYAVFAVFLRKVPVKRRASVAVDSPIDCGATPRKMVKMLSRDGQLVEVDLTMGRPVKKVTNEELVNWISSNKL